MMTLERLKSVVHYDPVIGIFLWKERTANRVHYGDFALSKDAYGYYKFMVDGHSSPVHRAAWFYMTGEWPKNDIDHINGIRSDNRFCNLRQAERYQNLRNMRSRGGTSKFKGVSFDPARGKWKAQIQIMGKNKYIGRYASEEEAAIAYNECAAREFGEFARLN